MPWHFKDGTKYEGGTHELVGRTFSGKTRTAASMPLVWTEEAPKPKPASSSKPKPKKKQPPKPKGSTAWD
jgi:hypothetical protein